MKKLTQLRKIESFKEVFRKLSIGDNMPLKEREYILSIALLFIKYYNQDKKNLSYLDIAYYIILKYSINYDDYEPLLNFSSQFGFYPITQWIRKNKIPVTSILDNIEESAINVFFKNNLGNYIETLEQNTQRQMLMESYKNELSYIAPTSFGKSQIIQEYLLENENTYHKIGVIVPSKSLLIQTYRNLRENIKGYKFLLHDEMYNDETNVLAILTQERATSLLRKKRLIFDILFIDEAHRVFSRDNRSLTLARLILLFKKLNPYIRIIYLSPLIANSNNLAIGENTTITEHAIKFNMKLYDVFLLSHDLKLYLYDRYTGSKYYLYDEKGYFETIINHSQNKNFIYTLRPLLVENLAKQLYEKLPNIDVDTELEEVISVLKTEVHRLFYGAKTLKKGIAYIHGRMPDLIKEFIEYCFKEKNSIKYIIANSVILEGINLPIDCLFITNTYRLYGKELTNLIGRVNRLNYVFKENNLSKLIPKVYFLNNEYNKGEMENKIKLLRKRVFDDDIKNPILNEYVDIKKTNTDQDEDIHEQNKVLIDSLTEFSRFSENHILSLIIESQISEFYEKTMNFNNQKKLAQKIHRKLNRYNEQLINTPLNLLDKIFFFFIDDIVNENTYNKTVSRLEHKSTRDFYLFFITDIIKYSLKDKIIWFFKNFKSRIKKNINTLLYVGHSFGEVSKESPFYNQSNNVYVDLSEKSDTELINLALVKLKMEEEFVGFEINKMISMLYDLDVITIDEYHTYVYGTTNLTIINYCKLGLSISCVNKLITDNKIEYIALNDDGNIIITNNRFWDYLEEQPRLFQFEVKKYITKSE